MCVKCLQVVVEEFSALLTQTQSVMPTVSEEKPRRIYTRVGCILASNAHSCQWYTRV